MPITIEATYEGGVLKPKKSLPLREHETVRVTIDSEPVSGVDRVLASSGLLGWKGDAETIERVALDPEFDLDQSL